MEPLTVKQSIVKAVIGNQIRNNCLSLAELILEDLVTEVIPTLGAKEKWLKEMETANEISLLKTSAAALLGELQKDKREIKELKGEMLSMEFLQQAVMTNSSPKPSEIREERYRVTLSSDLRPRCDEDPKDKIPRVNFTKKAVEFLIDELLSVFLSSEQMSSLVSSKLINQKSIF